MKSETNDGNWRAMWLPALVLAGVLFVYPMVLGIPLLDPDEGLHAAIAQEMVESGDWVTPKLLGEPFLDKPILYFWAEALSLKLFGMVEAAVRLPGLMFGLLGALTTAIVAWRMFGRTAGYVAGLFYATTILPTALAQAAAHDVALVPWINLALLLFWESDRATSRRAALGYTLAIGLLLGLTCLTKGLVGVAMVGLPYGAYLILTGRLTLAACLRGTGALTIAALVAALWYIPVELRNPGYLHYYIVERHFLGFATDTQQHSGRPWWYYLPIVLAGGLPWIGYLPITIRDGLTRWKWAARRKAIEGRRLHKLGWKLRAWWKPLGDDPHHGATVLLWCWLLGGLFFLSTSNSKMVTYVWPIFPAMAILAAQAWARLIEGTLTERALRSMSRTFVPSCLAAPVVLPIVMGVLQWNGAKWNLPLDLSIAAWSIIVAAALATWVPLWFWRAGRFRTTVSACSLTIAVQFAVIMTFALPSVAPSKSAKELAAHFNRAGEMPAEVMIADERIASVLFYLDPEIRAGLRPGQLRRVAMSEHPRLNPGAMLVLPERKVEQAARYYELDNVPYQSVGIHRLYRATQLDRRAMTAATELDRKLR